LTFNNTTIEDLNTFCYIQEQTSFEDDYGGNFGYNVVDRGNRFYVEFDAILQSFGIKNRNGREYDKNNIWNLIQTDPYIQDMLRKNSWLGEIDHPAAIFKGEELSMNRIANPDLKLTSHYIRSPKLDGNLLKAHIQTDSSNENGMNMAIKIVDGKIIPCFSARVLGALRNVMGKLIVYVNKLVTYDWVLFPSHPEAEAMIKQPHMESVSLADQAASYVGAKVVYLKDLAMSAANDSKEMGLICEAFDITLDDVVGLTNTGNSLVITENQNVYIQPISDKFIRSKTQREVRDWLNS
jgi:hypothetical protein